MAQTIKTYNVISKNSIGGRNLCVVEVTLGTEYLTEGFVVSPESCGLTVGLVDCAWTCSQAIPAKGAKSFPVSITTTETTIKLQTYEVGKEKEFNKEETSKGELASEYKVVFCVIGR